MKIELKQESAEAVIDTTGGIIERYTVAGSDVFCPRQEIAGKMRGGSHVCAPYFGPGSRPDLPQHGYARVVEWTVKEQSVSSVVLSHTQCEGEYDGLELELAYALEGTSLSMELTACNAGDRPLRLTPGFHPYFAVSEPTERVKVKGKPYITAGLAEVVFQATDSDDVECELADHRYGLTTNALREFALWTDRPDLYVCIEPTLAGNSFSEVAEGSEKEYLAPGAVTRYTCRIASR